MNNAPLNSTDLPICQTHTDAGVANGASRIAPVCNAKRFAGFNRVSEAEPSSIPQHFPATAEIQNLIFSHLSFSDLLSAERVSRCFRNNILLNHSKEIAYFRELSDTTRYRVENWITSASDYLIDYLERFSTTKPRGYFRAMQNNTPKAFVEIMYFNLRETLGQNLSFDTEFKAFMVHENRVHTVQSSADFPEIMSSSDAEVKMIGLIRGTQWVETLSTSYGRGYWGKYSAKLIANGSCLVTNNSDFVKIFERSHTGKWDHKTSIFDNNHITVRQATEFVRPGICNVLVNAYCRNDNENCVRLAKYCEKNSDGNWIQYPLGETDQVIVRDVTRDGRCALVSDGRQLFIYELTDDGPEARFRFGINSKIAQFSPDGTRILLDYGRNGAAIYIRSNQEKWPEEYIIDDDEDRFVIWNIQYSPDGTTIALNDSYRIEIHGQQGEGIWGRLSVFDDFDGCRIFSEILFSPDGSHGVITLASIHTETEKAQRIIGKISDGSWVEKGNVAANGLVVFSPDQIHVAMYSGRDQRITLYKLSDEKDLPEIVIIEHKQKVSSIKFSTDGSHVVTGSDDGLVRIWGQSGNRRWTPKAVFETHGPTHLVQFVMGMTHVLAFCDNKAHLYELKPRPFEFDKE